MSGWRSGARAVRLLHGDHRDRADMTLLRDLETVTQGRPRSTKALYDGVAPRYDHFRDLWLRLAGADAEEAMLEDIRRVLRPGMRVLDAGAGTGAISRAILAMQPDVQLTMLDISPAMLAEAASLDAVRDVGSVLDLPYPANSFDLVVSAWVIETVPDPTRAVQEYLRVVAPGGHVVYTFCSLPHGWFSRAGSALLREAVGRGFDGTFLAEQRTPWHDCEFSHRRRFGSGLTTEIGLSACCSVGRELVPEVG